MKKIYIYILVFSAIVLLSSCVELENTVSFNKDGSGTILLKYRISKMILESSDLDIPLPLTTEEFKYTIENHSGISIKKLVQEEDDTDMIITAELEFLSIEDLCSIYELSTMKMSLSEDLTVSMPDMEGEYTFTQTIFEGTEQPAEEISPETMEMLDSFFKGYNLNFTVIAPKPITYNNIGNKQADNTVSFSIPTIELGNSREDMVFIVKW